MRITFDTNIIIDILAHREPFIASSYLVLRNALENGDCCMMPVSAMTDVAYILRKNPDIREHLRNLAGIISMTDVTASDIEEAANGSMPDFEDALLAANARRNKADCIVTRNARDFANAPVRAVSPEELLTEWETDVS